MEFLIFSTSDKFKEIYYEKLKKEFNIKEKQTTYKDWYGNERTSLEWFIQINSIEQLLNLCKYESLIIHEKGYFIGSYKDYFCIEIYDDYRE